MAWKYFLWQLSESCPVALWKATKYEKRRESALICKSLPLWSDDWSNVWAVINGRPLISIYSSLTFNPTHWPYSPTCIRHSLSNSIEPEPCEKWWNRHFIPAHEGSRLLDDHHSLDCQPSHLQSTSNGWEAYHDLLSVFVSGWNDWPDVFTADTPCMLTEEKGDIELHLS